MYFIILGNISFNNIFYCIIFIFLSKNKYLYKNLTRNKYIKKLIRIVYYESE